MAGARLREVSHNTFSHLDPAHVYTIDLPTLGLIFRIWRVGEASRDMFVATPHWIAETRILHGLEPPKVTYMGGKSKPPVETYLHKQMEQHCERRAKTLLKGNTTHIIESPSAEV